MQDFDSFGLSEATLDAIAAKGYETPSPIQILSIPPLLAGQDLIAEAQTGTGKTAAFGVPMVEAHRRRSDDAIVALTLVPTRELAIQVAEEIESLARGSQLSVIAVYGGAGFGKQLDALSRRGTKLLVATPGRLLDHIQQGTIRLDRVETLVLDEADRMLDMGFIRDVERIIDRVPRERQTSLFSATMPGPVKKLANKYMHDPQLVKVEAQTATADLVEQFHVRVDKAEKQALLLDVLHSETPERAIVFTRTKHLARRLAERLLKGGWSSVALQGNMTQGQRERALTAFREGQARILVATDVAARGLDVPEVSHIVNFDLPDGADSYVHRIGRTARMGRTGRAFTFVQSDEARDWRDIERATGATVSVYNVESGVGDRQGPDEAQVRLHVRETAVPQRTGGGNGPAGYAAGHGKSRGGQRQNGGGRPSGGRRPQGGGAPRTNGSGGGGRRPSGGGGGRRRAPAGRSEGRF